MSPFLLLAALVPAAFLMVQVYRLDRIEQEPAGLLLKLALFGALSGLAAGAIEGALTRVLDVTLGGGMLRLMLENFLAVALVELSLIHILQTAANSPRPLHPPDNPAGTRPRLPLTPRHSPRCLSLIHISKKSEAAAVPARRAASHVREGRLLGGRVRRVYGDHRRRDHPRVHADDRPAGGKTYYYRRGAYRRRKRALYVRLRRGRSLSLIHILPSRYRERCCLCRGTAFLPCTWAFTSGRRRWPSGRCSGIISSSPMNRPGSICARACLSRRCCTASGISASAWAAG